MVPCVLPEVASSLNVSQMRPMKVQLKSLSRVQTAGISLILIKILRYFTNTQTGIQTATTSIFRRINVIFLFLRGCKVGPMCHLQHTHLTEVGTYLKGSPNSNEVCVHDSLVSLYLVGQLLDYFKQQMSYPQPCNFTQWCRGTHCTSKQKGKSPLSIVTQYWQLSV